MGVTVRIIVSCHKDTYVPKNKLYLPIQVGRATSNSRLNMVGDDTGDNISKLNPLYCELTGLYWAWKNLNEDYIGLAHYRRYFSLKKRYPQLLKKRVLSAGLGVVNIFLKEPKYGSYFANVITINNPEILDYECRLFSDSLKKLLAEQKYKLFALTPYCSGYLRIETFFSTIAGAYHIDAIRGIVKEYFPEIYPSLCETLSGSQLYYANMIIMQKDILDAYCNFVFSVLDKHLNGCIASKKYLSIEEKSLSRLSGYLGELLTSAYVTYYKKNNPGRVKLLSMLQYEEQV